MEDKNSVYLLVFEALDSGDRRIASKTGKSHNAAKWRGKVQ